MPPSGFELATQWSEAQHATAGLRRPPRWANVNLEQINRIYAKNATCAFYVLKNLDGQTPVTYGHFLRDIEVSAKDRVYFEVSAKDRVYFEVSAKDRVYFEVSAKGRVYFEVSAKGRVYFEVSAKGRVYFEVPAKDRVSFEVSAKDRVSFEVSAKDRVFITLRFPLKTDIT